MLRLTLLSFACLACIAAGGSADARPSHGGLSSVAPPGNAPILQSVSVPFGLLTRTAKGSVRLSSVDMTAPSIHPVTFPGLDLWVGGTQCATHTVTFNSGRSSTDFTLIAADTAEGSTAVTPKPSSTGQGNLSGNYVFDYKCKDANGNQSNTVQLTYTGVANAVNIGTGDSTTSLFPATFGNTTAQMILYSVGTDIHNSRTILGLSNFANLVTVEPADPARFPNVSNITTGNGTSNVRVTGFTASWARPSGDNVVFGPVSTTGTHDVSFDHDNFYGSEAMVNNNTAMQTFGVAGCSANCSFSDSYGEFTESGGALASNTTYTNITIRYIYGDCWNVQSSNIIRMYDIKCISPMSRLGGNHTDTLQVADNATPKDVIIQRFAQMTGDGDDVAQGIYFGGGLLQLTGYIDDGTAGHGPGTILTRLSGYWGTGAEHATIVISGSILASDNVTLHCLPSGCITAGTPTQAQLTGLAATNIGSPGSPVTIYGAGTQDFKLSGVVAELGSDHGFDQVGNGGTSWLYDFAYTRVKADPAKVNTFTGSIAPTGVGNHATLTATTTATTNLPAYSTGYINAAGRLNFPGCAYCSAGGIGSKLSGSDFGPGTYDLPSGASLGTVTSQTMQMSQAYDYNNGFAKQYNINLPPQGGTLNFDRGWFQGGFTGDAGFPSSNTTIGSAVFGYAPNGAVPTAADYASGMLPKDYLLAHPVTDTTTPDQILARTCLSQKGKIGGVLDRGAGFWNSAFTGETNSVTHTGGGDWIIFDGTNHVVSTHVTGCEAAP